MLIARFFDHDDNAFDFPLSPGITLPQLMATVQMNGCVCTLAFWLPIEAITRVIVYEATEVPAPPRLSVVPFTPPEKPA